MRTVAMLPLLTLGVVWVPWSGSDSWASSTSVDISLEEQLNTLESPESPEERLPRGLLNSDSEKIYAIQSRFVPLVRRSEAGIGVSRNFSGSGFLDTNQLDLAYRYHLSDSWSLGLSGGYVFNSLNSTGQRLLAREGIVPDVAYVQYRADVSVGYNVFYGKYRLSMDQVFYFDQYIALGAGVVNLNSGLTPSAVAELGFAFWVGRGSVIRVGLKDYFHNEKRRFDEGMANNLHGHLSVGILL